VLQVAALIASLAFLALVIAVIPALLQEHRTLAQQATKDLRQIEGVAVMAQDVLARVTNLTSLLSSFGTVGRVVGIARGVQKGIDVFVHRLARNRSKQQGVSHE